MIGVPIVGSPNTGDSQRAGLVADTIATLIERSYCCGESCSSSGGMAAVSDAICEYPSLGDPDAVEVAGSSPPLRFTSTEIWLSRAILMRLLILLSRPAW